METVHILAALLGSSIGVNIVAFIIWQMTRSDRDMAQDAERDLSLRLNAAERERDAAQFEVRNLQATLTIETAERDSRIEDLEMDRAILRAQLESCRKWARMAAEDTPQTSWAWEDDG